jgi:hypothetical protein
LLRPRDERPRDNDPRKKFDEFPSRHGFTRAKELIGYDWAITFWIEKLCRGHTPGWSKPPSQIMSEILKVWLIRCGLMFALPRADID